MMTPDRHGEIAKRAYDLWEVEGRPGGRDLDHWLRAEAETQMAGAQPAVQAPVEANGGEMKTIAPATRPRSAPRRTRHTQ